ncbi:MAG: hypothetical protein OXU31_00350 [Gammaproteobacteria bacterium]|nr:hypothetical protein [Gammaproteobacteria bacterium]
MKTQTIIFALVTVIFSAPAFADHNKTSLFFGLGQKEGHWTEISENGDLFEGHYVDGKRHGPWSAQLPNGVMGKCIIAKSNLYTDCIVNGKMHGRWVLRFPNGNIETGNFAVGKRHGHWFEQNAYREVVEDGMYVSGKKHGRWVVRYLLRGGTKGAIFRERFFRNGIEE